jgi:hypothetical protein
MPESSKEFKRWFLKILSVIYGGVIGAVILSLTSNIYLAWLLGLSVSGVLAARTDTGALACVCAFSLAVYLNFDWAGNFALPVTAAFTLAWMLVFSMPLQYLEKRYKITPETFVDQQISWILSFAIAINRSLLAIRSSIRIHKKLQTNQRAWDVHFIVDLTQSLSEVFPREWNEWQHWISDMMDSRTRMQSKGMNHHLVSLITFYRLTRFVFHIGIDKVFILATRRATR